MEIEIYKMIYNLKNKVNKMKILGEYFIINNKNKGKLIINNKKIPLKSEISINNINQNKIKMVLNKNAYNKSYIFKNCESLESISQISKNNNIENNQNEEININKEYQNFENEKTKILDNINTFNTLDNYSSFYGDTEINLSIISEIAKNKKKNIDSNSITFWNNELKYMGFNYNLLKESFSNCSSLLSISNI